MRNINLINEQVTSAKTALTDATAADVIDRCREYLQTLSLYREELTALRGLPEIDGGDQTAFGMEIISQARAAVSAAIEITVSETKRTNALLNSFTTISIHEAAETFNTFRYEGSNNWEAGPKGLRFSNGFVKGSVPTAQALEKARSLRIEAYVLLNARTSSEGLGDDEA